MDIILFDTKARQRLFPLTFTRAIADIRMGILTGKERWEKLSGLKVRVLTEAYLQPSANFPAPSDCLLIDASLVPSAELYTSILSLDYDQSISDDNGIIAGRLFLNQPIVFGMNFAHLFKQTKKISPVKRIIFPCNIFQNNEDVLRYDFELITAKRKSADVDKTVQILNPENVFIEKGATLSYTIINASAGPVYIGSNTNLMEGCLVRGPFALCEGATLKMGTRIYSGTTIGPFCTGGGEIKNSILMGYSNKGHDGYLGDSVIGEWCNLGAGTSNSNVKNTGSEVRAWNYFEREFISSGAKCGLIMGDYSRTSINTAFNTGTVAGVCCNIFGEGLTPKFIPDFTWGTKELSRYELEKALKDIENWKSMKNKVFTDEEKTILKYVFDNYND